MQSLAPRGSRGNLPYGLRSHSLFPLLAMVAAMLTSASTSAQDLASFEKRTTVHKLANGLTLVVCERHTAPVFSFFTHVNVGAVQEVDGYSGIAHMFEHMAFKGTPEIGSKDYAKEKQALVKVEDAYLAYRQLRVQIPPPTAGELVVAEAKWKEAIKEADKYSDTGAYDKILDQNGAVGLNAFTDSDETGYFYSLPVNRLELWAYLESERYLHPVFREFYKERDVVKEERRMRTESSPIGRLFDVFPTVAFRAHPYKRPVIGWMSDLNWFSATDAQAFFDKNYVPSNMVVAVVGDVETKEVIRLVEKYFGRLPKRPAPPPLATVEPEQIAEKTFVIHDPSQPVYLEGYHKPAVTAPDYVIYNAIQDILSNGRVSRLYRNLVRDKKIASRIFGFPGYPGRKYANLFLFMGMTTPGHQPQEIGKAIHEELERLKSEDVSDAELEMVKTRAKANLLRGLGDNSGLAFQFGFVQSLFGDWRELFREVDKIEKVTKADIRRIANGTFKESNRTVGMIVTDEKKADSKDADPKNKETKS